ncbi:MAG: zinc ribbon domain-containing protein [Proteobacteria bacterium]|nr:zinc ribbon domain-containing protein [Pseudomonadota bacterium]
MTRKTTGITGYGAYVPRLRMERGAIAAAHQWMAPALRGLAKGRRAFCSWDEDSVTMAVEAARDLAAGRALHGPHGVERLVLASTTLPYDDLQNAVLVGSALGLGDEVFTLDVGHSQRAGVAALLDALRGAADRGSLVIAADRPRARPASVQEMGFGAGAAAFAVGGDGVLAELLGAASQSVPFVDHFRAAGKRYDYAWEERWIRDEGYLAGVPPVIGAALAKAGVAAAEVKHFVLASPWRGTAAAVAKAAGLPAGSEADALDDGCGFAGCAQPLLMLAHTLQRARPGEVIVLVGFGQGCDVLVLRTTPALQDFKPARGVAGALADGQVHDAYLRMLSYDDAIELEWGMRAEKPVKTAQTEEWRSRGQLGAFVAGRCRQCGQVQFPQLAYCVTPGCHAPAAQFDATPLADVPCRVLTYTADWLSYHPSPPLYVGFVQFDNGARLLMEMVEVGSAGLEVGTPLRVVHRIKELDRARSSPRYFWKATPLQA